MKCTNIEYSKGWQLLFKTTTVIEHRLYVLSSVVDVFTDLWNKDEGRASGNPSARGEYILQHELRDQLRAVLRERTELSPSILFAVLFLLSSTPTPLRELPSHR